MKYHLFHPVPDSKRLWITFHHEATAETLLNLIRTYQAGFSHLIQPTLTIFSFNFYCMSNNAGSTSYQRKKDAEKHTDGWVIKYARIGIAAKGIVYILVGALAAMTVIGVGNGGGNNGKQGALQAIIAQPFGKILLAIVVISLLGYVVWRMIQAFSDPDGYGSDAKGMTQRAGFFISGLIYLFFAFSGVRMLLPPLDGGGSSNGGSGGGRQLLVAKALEQPFGQWLVGIAAAIIVGKGIYQMYRAATGNFKRKIKKEEMKEKEEKVYMRTGRAGYLARGIVLAILGYFLIQAALQSDASEAEGTEGAFNFLNMSGGPYLMAAVALGLVCYGLFMFVLARYRYMPKVGK